MNELWFTCRDCGVRTFDPDDTGEPPAPTRCAECQKQWDAQWKQWYAWEELPWWKKILKKAPKKPTTWSEE